MKLNLETQKKIASEWFRCLQLEICKEFEELERKAAKRKKIKPSTFKKKILPMSIYLLLINYYYYIIVLLI